jgi:hypothetical protein
LLRFDAALSPAAKQYFILDGITAQAQPRTIPLGGDTYLVFACSDNPHEPLHAIIVSYEWGAHMAAKELTRWLKEKPKETSLK